MAKIIRMKDWKKNPDKWQEGLYEEADLFAAAEVIADKLFSLQYTDITEARKHHVVNAEAIIRIAYAAILYKYKEAFGEEEMNNIVAVAAKELPNIIQLFE